MFYYEVMESLYRERVEYLLVGGLSVYLYGVPRVTHDIDLIISMNPRNSGCKDIMNRGFFYTLEDEKILEYMKLTDEQKLIWLEEIHYFTRAVLSEEEKEFREKLREGSI